MQGKAKQASQVKAMNGNSRQARQGKARQGMTWLCKAK
jgi:hypothetical protein